MMISQTSEASLNHDELQDSKPAFCRQCKHLIGRRDYTDQSDNWNCGHANNSGGFDLVSGRQIFHYPIRSLRYTIADNLCGQSGSWFEEYISPAQLQAEKEFTIGGKEATEVVFDDNTLTANRNAAAAALEALKKKKQSKLTNSDLSNL